MMLPVTFLDAASGLGDNGRVTTWVIMYCLPFHPPRTPPCSRYFPNHLLPNNVRATMDPKEAIEGAQYAIHAVPVQVRYLMIGCYLRCLFHATVLDD